MSSRTRNEAWKEIWERKGNDTSAPLHKVDGYDLLSTDEWNRMIWQAAQPLELRGNEEVFECGCGAGAFLASLRLAYPGLKVAGIDYSSSLIKLARRRLVDGDFAVADMTDLSGFASNSYDHVLSFGTFIYLSSEEAARCALLEMFRLTKPNGKIYVGEVSDLSKQLEAETIRRSSHCSVKRVMPADLDHLYLAKSFFQDIAAANAADLSFIDHSDLDLGDYQAARYRYSVYFTKR